MTQLMEANVRSTLGEVLLGRGHPFYAIRQLEAAREMAAKHPMMNEVRWDLALAYLCADRTEDRAQELLHDIRMSEAGREFRPFSDLRDRLGALRKSKSSVCPSSGSGEEIDPAATSVATP